MTHHLAVDLLLNLAFGSAIGVETYVISFAIIRYIERIVDEGREERQRVYLEQRREAKVKENYKFEEFDDLGNLDYKGVPKKKCRIKIGALVYDNRYETNQYYTLCNRCYRIHCEYHWSHTKVWNLYLDQIGELIGVCEVCHEALSSGQIETYRRVANRLMVLPKPEELENLRIDD